MRIEVWKVNDLVRMPDTTIADYPRQLRFIYEDTVSDTPKKAAERLWYVTSAPPHKLEGDDLELRNRWSRELPGLVFGVGDVVSMNGEKWEMKMEGMKRLTS